MAFSNVVYLLLLLRNQTKIYHWQTNFYPRHKASDELVDTIDELVDKYVETYQGIYSNLVLNTKNNNNLPLPLRNIDDEQMPTFLISLRKMLVEEMNKINDSELLNIKDEILQAIDKAIYLFRLQ